MKILALCDSPTLTTGFARVAQNLLSRWHACGADVDCWGIGFRGTGYRRCPYVNEFFPAGDVWYDPTNLTRFVGMLLQRDYTHVWIMQDTFLLSPNGFPKALREACKKKKIRSCLYFPVDAPIDADWARIVRAVDFPVAYTEYGKRCALAVLPKDGQPHPAISVLPHGVDTTLYTPATPEVRARLRQNIKIKADAKDAQPAPWLKPDDFLMINVNSNQRRKDPARSLEILAALRQRGVPAKLLMHMAESSQGLSLEAVGEQLGLRPGEEWIHNGPFFQGSISTLNEKQLIGLYHQADLYLTTTLGEGWGLGITEALGCGLPVAVPMNTACAEVALELRRLGMGSRVIEMPVEKHGVYLEMDNTRKRHRTDVEAAANRIEAYWRSGEWRERPAVTSAVREWLSWDRIAEAFLTLMGAEIKDAEPVQTPAAPAEPEAPGTGRPEVCPTAEITR